MGANDVAAVVHTSGRSRRRAGVHQQPAAAAERHRQVHGPQAALLADESPRGGADDARHARSAGERINDPDRRRARLSGAQHARLAEELRRGHRRRARPPQGAGVLQRGHRLRHQRSRSTTATRRRSSTPRATRLRRRRARTCRFYGIDVRGLGAGLDDGIEIQSFPTIRRSVSTAARCTTKCASGRTACACWPTRPAGLPPSTTTTSPARSERLVDDNSSYYVLGYYPANDRRDGRFRKIEVRVNKPGLTVRARRGYVAPRGRAPGSQAGRPERRLAGTARGDEQPGAGERAAAGHDGERVQGPRQQRFGRGLDARSAGAICRSSRRTACSATISKSRLLAVDAKGKLFPGDRNTLNLTLKPDTVARVRAGGFRVISSLDLPPGRYQLRVAAREANTRRAGSVLYDLEVPDFAKEPLSMSSIALTSMASSAGADGASEGSAGEAAARPAHHLSRLRAERRDRAVHARSTRPAAVQAHKVEISLTMKAEGGQTVFQTREERDSSELGGSSGGYGFSAHIPLRDIAPGLYVLRVEAQSRIGDRPSVSARNDRQRRRRPPATVAHRPHPPHPQHGAPAHRRTCRHPRAPRTRGTARRPRAPVAMTTINSDLMSGIDRAQQTVARTAAEWRDALAAACARPPGAGRRLHARTWSSRCFSAAARRADFRCRSPASAPRATRSSCAGPKRRPAPGQMAAQVMTAPSHLITVPRHDGRVRFEKVEP